MNNEWIDPESEEWADEDCDGYQVLALDPGGTTGWSIFQVHPDAMGPDPAIPVMSNVEWWTAGQIGGRTDDQVDQLIELINSWPNARLVTEQFILRQVAAVLAPVEINHTLKWALRPRYFVEQQPGLAMSTVTDDRQKSWGFWVPGKEHARDAVKHAITFLRRKKQQAIGARRSE